MLHIEVIPCLPVNKNSADGFSVGVRDGSYTEITGGLREGDELVIGYVEDTVAFGPGQGSPFGGGSGPFGGGGTFGGN